MPSTDRPEFGASDARDVPGLFDSTPELLTMASDPKNANPPTSGALPTKDKGVRIFTYPKVIFMFPTMVAALICGLGMMIIKDRTIDPKQAPVLAQVADEAQAAHVDDSNTREARVRRFT